MAVSASCSVALGLHSLVPRIQSLSSNTRTILSCLIPFSAAASATALNVLLMRYGEIRDGIDVLPARSTPQDNSTPGNEQRDDTRESLGHSRTAAAIAVGQTAISRVVNCIPTMAMTPLVYYRLQKNQDPASTTEDSSASEFGSHLVYLYRQPAFLTCCISPASVDQCCPLGGEVSRSTSRRWNSGI